RWPQLVLCLFALQWHARKIGSQPGKDWHENRYIMSGVATIADSDGRARVFYNSGHQGADILAHTEFRQSHIFDGLNGLRVRSAANQRQGRTSNSI
uniref:Rhs family protein n=1 Tax=Mesocestoides corti TaxID=53468 RepID=A0A5K3FP90_MESCO